MASRREIKILSRPESIHEVERFVEEISDQYHLNDNYFGNIMVALTEATLNAMNHGNKQDPEKEVHIIVEYKPEGLSFSVIDQGEGFDYEQYSDFETLLLSDNIKGRGLMLILSVADEVEFVDEGRGIQILVHVKGIENEVVEERQHQMEKFFQPKKKEEKTRREE